MKVGIFGDAHVTKNMRTMQHIWERSVMETITNMYQKFDDEGVDIVICLGDFFDKPIIEAKSLHLVLPILDIMNTRSYPTYILLGNHEIDDDDHNILEYLSEYDNILTVTEWSLIRENLLMIPYNVDIQEMDKGLIRDRYVFTHHDIYGSELAGGRSKAFFGLDPEIFKEAKFVFNGHVHLRSNVYNNIRNVGSILASQQGELRMKEYPQYYILDSDSGYVKRFDNTSSMIYLTIKDYELDHLDRLDYPRDRLVLRVEYENNLPDYHIDSAHTSFRKMITSISGKEESKDVVRDTNFDLKNYLVDYINKDVSVPTESKQDFIKVALEILS